MSARGHGERQTDIRDAIHSKHDQVFSVASPNGDLVPGAYDGIYFHDTRYLSRLELRVAGQPLTSLMADVGDGRASSFELSNEALQDKDGQRLPAGRLAVTRKRVLDDPVRESIVVENMSGGEVSVDLTAAFDCDFDPLMHVRGSPRGRVGARHPSRCQDGRTLVFRYDGADGHRRTTTVRLDPAPARVDGTTAVYALALRPRERVALGWAVELEDAGAGPATTGSSPARGPARGGEAPAPPGANQGKRAHLTARPGASPEGHRELAARLRERTSARTSNPMFDRVLERAFSDLHMLATAYGNDTFLAAGVPWYVALFGRDSAITAYEMLAWQPALARTTLDVLARFQASEVDDERDAEPGKILHELRVGELANLHEIPQYPYYGTVDATPWFLVLLGEYVRWTGDLEAFTALRDHVERALAWIDANMSRDLAGFVDYRTRSSKGMRNQGWKDSWNGIVNDDGSPAEPPIALVEVQAYVYHAKRLTAALFRRVGDGARGDSLEADAEALRQRVEQSFWMQDITRCASRAGAGPRARSLRTPARRSSPACPRPTGGAPSRSA